MAGLLGEGGITALPGTYNSSSPAMLADFRILSGLRGAGVDGRPCNIYQTTLNDTTGTMCLAIRVNGLQEASTTSKAITLTGIPQQFQLLEHTNGVNTVQGWLTTVTGADLTGTATANTATVIGFVMGRRE